MAKTARLNDATSKGGIDLMSKSEMGDHYKTLEHVQFTAAQAA